MNNIHYFQKRADLDPIRADLWQIEAGVVRAVICLEDGSLTTLGFWGAGDVVGTALLRQIDRLECLTPVMASPLLAENCPNGAMLAHIHRLQELLVIRSGKRIEEMLLKLLIWLGDRFGDRHEAGLTLKVLLTHQDLAETLNTTRVTITRSMGQLERQGTIRHLANRRLFIDKSAHSFDLVPTHLPKQLVTSIGQRSLGAIVGLATAKTSFPHFTVT
jgi:CRP-like cAMP-binding protein